MRKLGLLLAAGMVSLPLAVVEANAEPKLQYKKGAMLSFPDQGVELKLNTQLQPKYAFIDTDGEENESDFSMRRARLVLSGSALDGDVSFRLQNDFVGDSEDDGKRDSDLLDAWVQWNASDAVQLRFGQFKTLSGRQEVGSSSNLQFVNRSLVAEEFNSGRQAGVMLGGEAGAIEYAVAVTNGESIGEGRNRSATDTKMLGTGYVAFNGNGYDRSYEGDPEHSDDLAYTVGLSLGFGESEAEVEQDTSRVSGDVGLRSSGFSLQGEYFYQNTDPDLGDTVDDIGMYVQAGYFFVPKEWEVVGRFGTLLPDADDDTTEYTVGIGRYFLGHALKAQLNATFEQYEPVGGEDIDENRYEFQVSAYL